MINLPLFKCLLAAISVLRCVDAVAPSTNNADVAFEKMISGRALDAPDDIDFGLKDCAAIDDVCTTEDNKRCAARRAAAGGHAADVGPSLNGVELGVIATSGGHDGVPIAIGRPIAAADPWADPPPPYT